MSALKELYDSLKPLLTSGRLYAAREKLKAVGFPDNLIPEQLDAARELIRRQRDIPRRETATPHEEPFVRS
jgi:hypothetical protein